MFSTTTLKYQQLARDEKSRVLREELNSQGRFEKKIPYNEIVIKVGSSADKVKKYRKRIGLTQAELNTLAGIISGTVTEFEKKCEFIQVDELERIAKALGLNNRQSTDLFETRFRDMLLMYATKYQHTNPRIITDWLEALNEKITSLKRQE